MTSDAVNCRSKVTAASHAFSLLTSLFDSSWQKRLTQTDLLVQHTNFPLNTLEIFAILPCMHTQNPTHIKTCCVGNGHITGHLLWIICMTV